MRHTVNFAHDLKSFTVKYGPFLYKNMVLIMTM